MRWLILNKYLTLNKEELLLQSLLVIMIADFLITHPVNAFYCALVYIPTI